MTDDFAPRDGSSGKGNSKGSPRWSHEGGWQSGSEAGHKRKWLKAFEQAPAQMLNVYGQAKHDVLSDEQVWQDTSKELKSGAAYMSEFCDPEDERRGVGANRSIHAMLLHSQ